MEAFMFYLGKMILCSAVMFAYYLLFLKDKTFHHYNRFYLLLMVIISLVLPLIKVSYFTIETNQNFYLLLSQLNQKQFQNSAHDITNYSVFYAIIGVVSIILLIRLLLGIVKIQSIRKRFPNEIIEGIRFYQTNLDNAPFSFFRNLFWKQSIQLDSPVGQQILKHEMVHIQQKHSWDKLLMQTVKSVFWFNPLFYFINKEINLIHEYLADNKAVKKSDTRAFAQMLLESHFSGSVIPVTSPFLSSNLKKRLKMLTKNQTKYSYARKLFALPILFLMVFAYMVNAKNKEITETNKVIDLAVKELKNDTIKPKASELDSLTANHQRQSNMYSDALQEDHLKMSAISTKMADKSKALSALTKAKKEETPEYKALENEMQALANEMESIVSSENYRKNLKGLQESSAAIGKLCDSPEFKKKIADAAKKAAEAEKMVNSPEFKKRIADAEKRAEQAVAKVYDSPEFKKRLEFAEKLAQSTSDNFGKIYNEADFEKMIKDQYGKDAFTDGTVAFGFDASDLPDFKDFSSNFNYNFSNDIFYNTEKTTLTPKELKKLEKKRAELQKKQKELLEEQKKLQKKQQELNKEARQNNPLKISFNSSLDSPKAFVYNKNITPPQRISKSNQVIIFDKTTDGNPQHVFKADAIKITNTSDAKGSFDPNKAKVYINGKLTDIKEVDKIDPNMIASVNIFSTNDAGKIEIITK